MVKTLLSKLKKQALSRALPVCVLIGVVASMYIAGAVIEQGVVSWLASLPALGVIAVTALARVNDIKPEQKSWTWQARRIGLVLTGAGAVVLAYSPIQHEELAPTWRGLALYYGFAMTWITTPNMPPWWKYVSGEAKARTTGD